MRQLELELEATSNIADGGAIAVSGPAASAVKSATVENSEQEVHIVLKDAFKQSAICIGGNAVNASGKGTDTDKVIVKIYSPLDISQLMLIGSDTEDKY